jgi:Eukaryotic cytochrome b561
MTQYWTIVAILIAFSLGMGYFAGIQPAGSGWRYFSWHPLLMTCGMVGMSGIAAVTKKLGGYTNTKLHAVMSFTATTLSLSGIYVIYRNKELSHKMHLQSNHAIFGAGVMVSAMGLGMAGSIFLHPDFGLQKTNQTIRAVHKWGARITLILAWTTAFLGLLQMVDLENEAWKLAAYAFPLVALVPFVLM